MWNPTRPSPALVVACLALFVAGGGTAVAARDLITGKDIKNGSIQLADLSKKARQALHGAQGPAGPPGARGATGARGPAGTARAYAIVNSADLTTQKARGVSHIRRPMTGIYCITVPGANPTVTGAAAGQATIGAWYADGHVSIDWSQCNTNEYQVATMSDESNQFTNQIDFWFLVP